MRSPVLGKNIALARVDVAHSEIGTEVEIGKLDGHQKRLPAKITAFPHYDPQKTKPRGCRPMWSVHSKRNASFVPSGVPADAGMN